MLIFRYLPNASLAPLYIMVILLSPIAWIFFTFVLLVLGYKKIFPNENAFTAQQFMPTAGIYSILPSLFFLPSIFFLIPDFLHVIIESIQTLQTRLIASLIAAAFLIGVQLVFIMLLVHICLYKWLPDLFYKAWFYITLVLVWLPTTLFFIVPHFLL